MLHYTETYCAKVLCSPKINNRTLLLSDLIVSGAAVDPTKQVCSSAILVLSMIEKWKGRRYDSPVWFVCTKFRPNLPSVSRDELCGDSQP
jgi:hypothetical protein